MSNQYLFLSDVHYGDNQLRSDREIRADLTTLIDHCQKNRIKICLLGDLFDYWMEFPDHIPDLGSEILERFRIYMKEFGPILYITGNHDNWTRGYFHEIGFEVEPEYKIIQLDDSRGLLMHGDGLSDPDFNLARPLYHRILRHPKFVRIYQALLPPSKGLQLMNWFSKLKKSRPTLNPAKLNDWAGKYLDNNAIDFVICGHDHKPRIETFPSGIYINTGAFYKYQSAVLYTNGQFKLVSWNKQKKQMVPLNELNTSIDGQQFTK